MYVPVQKTLQLKNIYMEYLLPFFLHWKGVNRIN